MNRCILLIEDEVQILEICRDYLQTAGYDTISATDGTSGLAAFHKNSPALVVLDLMLPGLDGWEICKQIRKGSNTPIIMLTARHKESDKLLGLEMGADDYITKPFSPRELVVRVRTVLRRAGEGPAVEPPAVNRLTLDQDHYRVIMPEGEISLTPTEFDILSALKSQPGRVFSRAQLLKASHGVAFKSYERAIDSHIRNLRRKLDPDEGEERHIITVHGYGYKFVE
jgi:two-component system, OmpR family, response regulator